MKQIEVERVTKMMFEGVPPEKHNEFLQIMAPWAFAMDDQQEAAQRKMLYDMAIWAETNPLEFAVITSGVEWQWLGKQIVFSTLPWVRSMRAQGHPL